jgi:hypothetical protein
MPYYIYKVSTLEGIDLIKNLELINQFDLFKEAKTLAKKLRSEQEDERSIYKLMFAENQLLAEEQLLEKREKPILMEYER